LREGIHTVYWWKHLTERYNLEKLGEDGKKILKRVFKMSYTYTPLLDPPGLF
jgi:hypothetical protein